MLLGRLDGERVGAGVPAQRGREVVVGCGQADECLVGPLLVDERRRVVRLQEVDVEVPRRLRGGALVRRAHEQVAQPRHVLARPRQLVEPDPVAGDVRLVALLEHLLERLEVGVVEPVLVEVRGTLLDALVVVDVLADVEVELAVVFVAGQELAGDGPDDLLDDRLQRRADEAGIHLGNVGGQQAQVVAQLVDGHADRHVDVVGGEAVNSKPIDDAEGDRHVLTPRHRPLELPAQAPRHGRAPPRPPGSSGSTGRSPARRGSRRSK